MAKNIPRSANTSVKIGLEFAIRDERGIFLSKNRIFGRWLLKGLWRIMKNVLILSSDTSRVEALRNVFSQLPDFELSGQYNTLRALLEHLQERSAEVVFLDSEVALAPGVPLLLRAEEATTPLLVVLSSDGEGAVQSYGVAGVVDYLVMPCPEERLAFCVERLRRQLALCQVYENQQRSPGGNARDFVFIKVNKRYMRLPLEEIAYAESVKDYIRIVCEKRSLLVYNTLSNFTAALPPDRFLRIHRSYTVAVDKIDWMDGNSVEVLGTRLPLTRKYLTEEQQRILR